jgi:hypothetical protein
VTWLDFLQKQALSDQESGASAMQIWVTIAAKLKFDIVQLNKGDGKLM